MKTRQLPPVLLLCLLVFLPTACTDKPVDRVGPPIELGDNDRARILRSHNAVPAESRSMPVDTYVSLNSDLPDCQRCHSDSSKVNGRVPGKAHWEIEMRHARGMQCATCHDLQAPETGVSLSGPVPLAHNDLVCRTCHKKEVADWEGGAHGKRLSGWAEPRVIAVCVHCHDPHAPSIARRMPVGMPKIVPSRLQGQSHQGGQHE